MPEITFDAKQGACREYPTEWWYPDKSVIAIRNGRTAVRICNGCVVRGECLMYSLPNETHGIWGGLRESERESERRRLNIRLTAEALSSISNSTRRASRRLDKERDYAWNN
jgi:hypothetical protein